jgi:hypothetical protein
MLNNNIHTNCEQISEFIEDILSILPWWIQRRTVAKSDNEGWRALP